MDGEMELCLKVASRAKAQMFAMIQRAQESLDKGKAVDLELKPHRIRRSLDANGYLWILCQKIAEVVGSTKEDVYQKAIREVGQFEILPIRKEAVERFLANWGGHGLGWFAETIGQSKLPGYVNVIAYYGSSTYDTREMSVLIHSIVDECKGLGIETMTPEELERLKEEWK